MNDRLGLYAETLGAYMEGKLSKGEMSLMDKVVNNDSDVHEIFEEIQTTDINWNDNIRDDFPDFENRFTLPHIPSSTSMEPQVGIAGLQTSE